MKYVFLILAFLAIFSFSGCVSATPVPYGATPEEIEYANAKNLEATAQNTAVLAGVTIASIAFNLVVSLFGAISPSSYQY